MFYENLTHGFDARKAFFWIAAITIFGSATSFIISMYWYAQFAHQGIIIKRPPFFQEVRYPYQRVRGIARVARFRAPNGNIVARPYYAIRFDDGTKWTMGESFDGGDPAPYRAVIGFVSRRSNRDVRNIDFIEELGP